MMVKHSSESSDPWPLLIMHTLLTATAVGEAREPLGNVGQFLYKPTKHNTVHQISETFLFYHLLICLHRVLIFMTFPCPDNEYCGMCLSHSSDNPPSWSHLNVISALASILATANVILNCPTRLKWGPKGCLWQNTTFLKDNTHCASFISRFKILLQLYPNATSPYPHTTCCTKQIRSGAVCTKTLLVVAEGNTVTKSNSGINQSGVFAKAACSKMMHELISAGQFTLLTRSRGFFKSDSETCRD